MGKPKKGKKNNTESVKVSLEDQITNGGINKSKKNKFKLRFRAEEEDFVDAKTSERILSIARKQQSEIFTNDSEFGPSLSSSLSSSFNKHRGSGGGGGQQSHHSNNTNYRIKSNKFGSNDSDSDEDDFDNSDNAGNDINPDDYFDDIKLTKEDEKAIAMFQNKGGRKTRKLADVILEKIAEKEVELQEHLTEVNSLEMEELDPRVREMYEGVRDVMKRYRSGKVPKAFKLIPKLRNWEQILFVTEPHNWSASAMYQGARIFASVLTQNMAQRFFNLVLLPRIRDDLSEYKRLNPHLYNALKKSLFKPAAFMKGIILPLLESGDCTLREAIIFGSIIARHQIPILHSSACLLKICEMEYSGANSIFIRIFLDKRYALPYRVVDGAVYHFLRFEHDKREMPVLWHQSFLTFVQRYKNDISSEQKDALNEVLKKQYHPKITPDIRRELQAGRCRDQPAINKEEKIEQEMNVSDVEYEDCLEDMDM